MKWNQNVVGTYNHAANTFDEQSEVNSLLCTYGGLTETNMNSSQGYTEYGDNQDKVAGYSFDNIAIFHAVNGGQSDRLAAEKENMDKCLTVTDSAGYLHYDSIGLCMQPSG